MKNRSGEIHPWADRSAWFELENPSPFAVSLDGWQVRGIGDRSSNWMFPPGVQLAPGALLPVWADPSAAPSTTPAPHLNCAIAIDSEFEHDYSAWGLELVTPDGRIADRIQWGMQIPDQSIGRDATGSWKLLTQPSRGTSNSAAAALGAVSGIRINEWTGRDLIPGGSVVGQFSELFNPSILTVDLGGLWLGDSPGEAAVRKWRFPPLSFIGPTSHALLLPSLGGNDPARLGFNLNRGGEMLILSSDQSSIDSVAFGLGSTTRSQGRIPDGGTSISDLLPSPGGPNIAAGASTPVFYLHPRSRSVAAGGSHTLSAEAQPVTSYQWLRNGTPIPGANAAALTISPITTHDDAIYQCLAFHDAESASSAPAELTVIHNYALLAAEKSLGSPNADDDGDGVRNAIELLTGTDPLVANGAPGSIEVAGTPGNRQLLHKIRLNSRASWTRLYTDLSTDCRQWIRSEPTSIETLSIHSNGDRTVRFSFPSQSNTGQEFLRLGLDP